MMAKPKVFVTRILPEAGMKLIKEACDAEIWQEPLPPPYAFIKQKIATCQGLASLLTDKVDAELLDAAPIYASSATLPSASIISMCLLPPPAA